MSNLDILLIVPPSRNPAMYYAAHKQSLPPLGLGYIATYLKQQNYKVKILDLFLPDNTVNMMRSILKHHKPYIVGFTCTTETYNTALRLAEIVRTMNAKAIIVFGGPHVSFEYESVLNTDIVDYVVINEGEITFSDLCDYCINGVGNLEEIKGIAYKENNIVICNDKQPFIENLDILPIPDRLLFDDLFEYAHPSTIVTSRGCPGKCIFCAAGVLSGGKYRMRSVENIIQELKYLKSLGFSHADILDDTLTADMSRLDNLLEELMKQELKMTFYCESRVDAMSKDVLRKMKAAGISSIQFGVESGNKKTLDSIKKDITVEQVINVFKWCEDIGIKTFTNMIIGLPYEDASSIEDTICVANEIFATGAELSFTVCTPFPGTSLWKKPMEFDMEIVNFDLDYYDTFTPVFNTKNFNSRDIRNIFYGCMKTLGKMRLSRIPTNNENLFLSNEGTK